MYVLLFKMFSRKIIAAAISEASPDTESTSQAMIPGLHPCSQAYNIETANITSTR